MSRVLFALSIAKLSVGFVLTPQQTAENRSHCKFPHGVAGARGFNHTIRVRATNSPRSFEDYDTNWKGQGLFVDPEHNFAFCSIEKNGCAEWNLIFSKLVRNDPATMNLDFKMSRQSMITHGPRAAEAIFSNPNATRAVFVRDPLKRFVSAYMDKCASTCSENCMEAGKRGDNRLLECNPKDRTFENVLKWMMSMHTSELIDGHWQLQSDHCELKDRLHEYNIIGYMRKETLGVDSACIMDRAGISEFNTRGPKAGNAPFWAQGDFVHAGTTSSNEEEDMLKKLFTKRAARRLIRHLHQDYTTFGFDTQPAWVEKATGEWYSLEPNPKDEKTSRHVLPHVSEIVQLAAYAGFAH